MLSNLPRYYNHFNQFIEQGIIYKNIIINCSINYQHSTFSQPFHYSMQEEKKIKF